MMDICSPAKPTQVKREVDIICSQGLAGILGKQNLASAPLQSNLQILLYCFDCISAYWFGVLIVYQNNAEIQSKLIQGERAALPPGEPIQKQ
jgi:hypothetical protein